jgi:heptosyltransferase I
VKILFVKLGAIGDIVHTLPALSAMRKAMPEAHISWAAERRSAEILRGNPLIDELIEIDTKSIRRRQPVDELLKEIRMQAKGLRRNKYDVAIDFQGLLKSAAIAKLSGARRRFGFARQALREPASRFLLTDALEVPKEIHVIHKNMALAAAATGVEFPRAAFDFPIATASEHVREAAEIAERVGPRFAILNPGGGWATKLWPAEDFGDLARLLWDRHRIASVISIGPKEEHLAERALKHVGGARVTVASASLKGFYELSKLSSIYIGGDTGPTHLAVAAGTPVVGLFGPTEWWRNGSPNPLDVCVERLDIGCRADCHRRRCSNWICMQIPAETVLNAAARRLGLGVPSDLEVAV